MSYSLEMPRLRLYKTAVSLCSGDDPARTPCSICLETAALMPRSARATNEERRQPLFKPSRFQSQRSIDPFPITKSIATMGLNGISMLIRLQWQQLRSALDVKGHEHRVQQRLKKKEAKQQRKAARRAVREARRAQRKGRNNEATSLSSGGKQSKKGSKTNGRTWGRSTEALTAIDPPGFSKSDTSMRRQDALQDTRPVGAVYDASAASIMTDDYVTAAPKTETQVDHKQRMFYDSMGGYSTVDEDEDEVHEVRARGRANEAKQRDTTISHTAYPTLHEVWQQDRGKSASPNVSPVPFSKKTRARTLGSSFELVKTKFNGNSADSMDFRRYSTVNVKAKPCNIHVVPNKFRAPSHSCSEVEEQLKTIDGFHPIIASSWSKKKVGLSIADKVEVVSDVDVFNPVESTAKKHSNGLNNNDKKLPSPTCGDSSSKKENEAIEPLHQDDKGRTPDTKVNDGPSLVEVVTKAVDTTNFESVVVITNEIIADDSIELDEDTICRPQPIQTCPNSTPFPPKTINEYASSLHKSLRAREHRYHVTEDIFAKQQSVRPQMRAVLVDWLVEVHQRFELEPQTLFLTVNYIDRYLAQTSVKSQRFQLVGVAALLIASKFEEIYPCDMDDLLYICERPYAKADLVDCERHLLNLFQFNLAVPSVSSFLTYYLAHLEEADDLITQLASYFAEFSLLDFAFGATYEPSIIASSCLLAAVCYVECEPPGLVWNSRLVELTRYSADALVPCTRALWSLWSQPCELMAVETKYSAKEFGEVAHLPLEDLAVLLK